MKIAVIAPHRRQADERAAALSAMGHAVIAEAGNGSRLEDIVAREHPDLLCFELAAADHDELAAVEGVTVHHPQMAVMLLCPTHSPTFLLRAMRAGVREVLETPPAAGTLEAAVQRIAAKLQAARPADAAPRGKVIAFMPCKGGSGATFLATNLGYQLAEQCNVLLIDLNLQFGDALSFVHDGRPTSTLADVARDIGRLDASFLAASAVQITPRFSILAAPEDPSDAPLIRPEHLDAILTLAESRYDFVLLDVPRTLDPLAIRALDRAARIYPVLQVGMTGLRNATRLLTAFRALGYASDKLEVIVNRYEKGGEIGLDDMRRAFGPVGLRTVPNSWREVSRSIDHGYPLNEVARANAVARTVTEFMQSLNPSRDETRGFLERMFRRA